MQQQRKAKQYSKSLNVIRKTYLYTYIQEESISVNLFI